MLPRQATHYWPLDRLGHIKPMPDVYNAIYLVCIVRQAAAVSHVAVRQTTSVLYSRTEGRSVFIRISTDSIPKTLG